MINKIKSVFGFGKMHTVDELPTTSLIADQQQIQRPQPKELFDHTETFQLHKGKIIMLLNDGTALYEELQETAPLATNASSDCLYEIYETPSPWRPNYCAIQQRQGTIAPIMPLEQLFVARMETIENQTLVRFNEKYINKDRIKEISLVEVSPWKKESVTYKKFKE